MLFWLLFNHIVILSMKVLLFILECVDDESNCSSNTKKILGFGFYLVLYPILIIWNVVGMVWFINIQNMYNNECVRLYLI